MAYAGTRLSVCVCVCELTAQTGTSGTQVALLGALGAVAAVCAGVFFPVCVCAAGLATQTCLTGVLMCECVCVPRAVSLLSCLRTCLVSFFFLFLGSRRLCLYAGTDTLLVPCCCLSVVNSLDGVAAVESTAPLFGL